MKNSVKFILVLLMTTVCSLGYGQDYLSAPNQNEKIIGSVLLDNAAEGKNGHSYRGWYYRLLEKAKREYPGKVIDIREITVGKYGGENCSDGQGNWYYPPAFGRVVEINGNADGQTNKALSQAMDKAFRNVREGSRVAVDMVTVSGGVKINREDLKDQILDALLDKGYKVVAKDYLEKLYDEQQTQQSGIYNEKTTVQENNFSAVGYYVNVKVSETSLRVQVVNVSTGEYEGNATITF